VGDMNDLQNVELNHRFHRWTQIDIQNLEFKPRITRIRYRLGKPDHKNVKSIKHHDSSII